MNYGPKTELAFSTSEQRQAKMVQILNNADGSMRIDLLVGSLRREFPQTPELDVVSTVVEAGADTPVNVSLMRGMVSLSNPDQGASF